MTTKKAGFKNKAQLTHMGGKWFRLDRDLTFYSAEMERTFITPKGTRTDFASIPAPLQSFVQVLGNNIRSCIMHDFHCTPEGKKANKVNQKQTDDLLREGLALDHVRWSKARVMTAGVRGFQRLKYLFKREKYNG